MNGIYTSYALMDLYLQILQMIVCTSYLLV